MFIFCRYDLLNCVLKTDKHLTCANIAWLDLKVQNFEIVKIAQEFIIETRTRENHRETFHIQGVS